MNIRWKTLSALFVITLIVMSILFVVTQQITFNGIAASEKQSARQNAQRFISNLNIDLANLKSTVYDWSVWDDTYNFVENNNTAYIESNLIDQTLTDLNIDMILYFNTSQQLVFGKAFDLSNETDVPLKSDVVSQISSDDFLFSNHNNPNCTIGLVLIGNQPALIAASPILTSLEEGPYHGTLIMARYFDTSELNLLTQAVGLHISTVTVDQPDIPSDFRLGKIFDDRQVRLC